MTLINIHNVAIDNHFCYVLVAYEKYVLNANILVFMLIHTELFSNVSGLGLGLEKNWTSASLFLASASALASCPAGLVNITVVTWHLCFGEVEAGGKLSPLLADDVAVLLECSLEMQQLRGREGSSHALRLAQRVQRQLCYTENEQHN